VVLGAVADVGLFIVDLSFTLVLAELTVVGLELETELVVALAASRELLAVEGRW
jgi:hypothetical protein